MKRFLSFVRYTYVAIFARVPTCWQGDVAAIVGDSLLYRMDAIGSASDREQPGP